MAHVRKQIRDRVASVLTDGVASVNSRVYISRVYPITSDDLPALTVSINSEQSSMITLGTTKSLGRRLSINIDIYARSTSALDDSIDAIAVEIEQAIAADFTVNGLAKEAILSATNIEHSGEAEKPVGIARLSYDVLYHTSVSDPETAK
jgi:hypothetical protein